MKRIAYCVLRNTLKIPRIGASRITSDIIHIKRLKLCVGERKEKITMPKTLALIHTSMVFITVETMMQDILAEVMPDVRLLTYSQV